MNIRHLTFRLLQVYVAVVRLGSVTRAAEQLHLAQPTVSQQLKRLAESVGAPLLETRAGALQPTAVGQELYHAALDALSRFEDFGDFLGQARLGIRGHFSVGVVTTAKYILPRLLGPFSRQYPGVEITVNVGNRGHVLQRFEQQADDLYLFSHPPTGAHAVAGRFLRNPLVLIAPPDHWAAALPEVDMPALLGERFLLREPGSATRMVFEHWLRQQSLQLGRVMQIESNEVIRLSVASGLGLAVLSEHTLEAGDARVARLAVPDFPLLSHWYVVAHGDRRLSFAAENFLRFVDAHLASCVEPRHVSNALGAVLARVCPPEAGR